MADSFLSERGGMHWRYPVRGLLALVAMATLPMFAQAPASQQPASSPGQETSAAIPVSPGPGAQVEGQAPAAIRSQGSSPQAAATPASTAAGTAAAKGPPPTPEEVADALQVRKRYQEAIAAYKKVEHPSAAVWNKMGIAYQMMFDLNDARQCYERSLKLNHRDANVLNNLATTYDTSKNYKKAAKLYRKALKITPKSAMILKNLGTNLLEQHKYKKGLKLYEQAAAIDPDIFSNQTGPAAQNPTSVKERGALNYYMAQGCLRSGQTQCAIQYLRMALNEGYTSAHKLASDADFEALRDYPAFKDLLAEQEQQKKQQRNQPH